MPREGSWGVVDERQVVVMRRWGPHRLLVAYIDSLDTQPQRLAGRVVAAEDYTEGWPAHGDYR